jgi:hypothetical protein
MTLGGIGKFRMTESVSGSSEEQLKSSKGQPTFKILFDQDVNAKEDENLISFISLHTGKMKSLAAADLYSHMELARQFLNIGKPFLMEGIGTLVKIKSGQLEFTQDLQQPEKVKESATGESQTSFSTEDSFTDYNEMFSSKKPPVLSGKKILIGLSILAGIGLAIWGGYKVYNNSTDKSNTGNNPAPSVTIPADTLVRNDTLVSVKPPPDTTQFRYVIEESERERALKRFNDLKSYGLNIRMETKDSVLFKIYFLLVSSPADTARICDSLTLLYGTMGRTRAESSN